MKNNGIESIKKNTASEIIVQKLIGLIQDSSIKPGDRLPPERELSEMLGVSRPSLREALKAMQMMNIVDIRHGAGTYVKRLEPESVVEHLNIVLTLDNTLYKEIYDTRLIFECASARMAAENITDELIEEIESNLDRAEAAVDNPLAFLELDYELHRLVSGASGNRIISVFVETINKLNLALRNKTNDILSVRQNTIKDHKEIFEALKARDAARAERAMKTHLMHIKDAYYDAIAEQGD